jgi:carbon monoxide dehydrogenase subunit G
MIVHGTFRLEASREDVFRAICDPGILMAVIPGCEAIEQVGAAEYRGTITLRLPGIVGRYRTSVRLLDAVAPERAGLEGRVDGALGSIVGRADFALRDQAGGTVIDYHGQGVVDGPLARLDSRFIEGLAGSLIAQGLRALDRRLSREPLGVAIAGRPRPSTEVSE